MNNYFCVLPWYSQELGFQNTPCCLLPLKYNIDQIKQDLLSNVQTAACKKCWDIESSGNKSRRQFENEFLDYKLDRDLDKIQQDCADSKHQTLLYQITTSNLCNQACVSCNSKASTKWAQVEKRMNIIPNSQYQIDLDSANINYGSAKRISLLGGEPLFDPKTFEILQKLIDHNNTNCFISLVTNGSIFLNAKQIDLLQQFTDLNICISIDGIGPVFEYMRWPGKWSNLLENINQYKSITKNISVSYTVGSLNAMYYDQTVNWFKQNNLTHNHNIVSHPNWLSLANMPVVLKQHLKQHNNFIKMYCNTTGSEIALGTLAQNIIKQDHAKNINIKDYMPEVAAVIFDNV
jgi:wyosine [tRNA(Phe)-imidazoG37] synthetase (radical SAM superfamily)